MEADKNPFPKMDLLPGIQVVKRIARIAGNLLVPFHCEAPDYMSEHFRQPFEELYDTPVASQPSLWE